ncbi:hypothetical protein [Streptomyces sp. NPDC021562]|uniref:hypothetical protein n=1 Tax=Streptomyces sp. NPDC021562 TaxID=3155121 RepID=UPI0010E9C631
MLRVSQLTPTEARELFQVREALEGLAVAQIIASPHRQEAAEALRGALEKLHDAAIDITGSCEARRAAGPPVVSGGTMPCSYVAATPPFSLDPSGQRMRVDGVRVALTSLELRLLSALLRGP